MYLYGLDVLWEWQHTHHRSIPFALQFGSESSGTTLVASIITTLGWPVITNSQVYDKWQHFALPLPAVPVLFCTPRGRLLMPD